MSISGSFFSGAVGAAAAALGSAAGDPPLASPWPSTGPLGSAGFCSSFGSSTLGFGFVTMGLQILVNSYKAERENTISKGVIYHRLYHDLLLKVAVDHSRRTLELRADVQDMFNTQALSCCYRFLTSEQEKLCNSLYFHERLTLVFACMSLAFITGSKVRLLLF